VAKRHQQVRRQRRGLHHKVARALVHHYDTLFLEDLRVADLVRNARLAIRTRQRVPESLPW